jgi:retron-type reverse transcriptase
LYSTVCDPLNLWQAYRRARLSKGSRIDVARFDLNAEVELYHLQHELQASTYEPGGYRHFTIYERKPRLISIAPFRDRVVHHAVMGVLEPLLDKTMMHDSYACRQSKGVHRADATAGT